MLYPKVSPTREVITLDGIWKFKLDKGQGFSEKWYETALRDTILMQVPASYNDLAIDEEVRHHIGWVWYERELIIPKTLLDKKLSLRFSAVTHECKVYLNGQEIGFHKGGFTPFEIELNPASLQNENRLTVAVNNIVDYSTLPVGIYEEEMLATGEVKKKNIPNFDFFNYSGIQRSVHLVAVPMESIYDITIVTDFDEKKATISYEVESSGDSDVRVFVEDEDKAIVASAKERKGIISLDEFHLWEPLNAYLYQLRVELVTDEVLVDSYSQSFGIRTVEVKGSQFLVNKKPFYFKGYGKHEDTIGNGRGLNPAMNLLDLNLVKWSGANSIRTAHYPYAEEFMDLADRLGIVVIDETPAVGLTVNFNATQGQSAVKRKSFEVLQTQSAHEQVLRELIARDKNHPCVVMWSIANEPGSDEEGAEDYFAPLVELTKKLDKQGLPVTIVQYMGATAQTDRTAELVDVICLNRYYGWYINLGSLEEAKQYLAGEMAMWQNRCPDKPIMLTEYGADTLAGFHDVYNRGYTEEYQAAFYQATHEVVDTIPQFIGEQVWNFADFETSEGLLRVGGNKKGIFTRDRKPKAAAYHLKKRWEKIPNFNYKK